MTPKRGSIFMAQLDPTRESEQAGMRPVIVVSRDAINEHSSVVVIVPVTNRDNKRRVYPSQIVLKKGDGGLTLDSVVLCEQIRAISSSRLTKYMGQLSANQMSGVASALRVTLDL